MLLAEGSQLLLCTLLHLQLQSVLPRARHMERLEAVPVCALDARSDTSTAEVADLGDECQFASGEERDEHARVSNGSC